MIRSEPTGTDPHNLMRFVVEQRRCFPQALEEIQAGRKTSHWMWYVIPTPPYIVDGIERGSPINREYALRTDAEARDFLTFTQSNVCLRDNYLAILQAILEQLQLPHQTPLELMGALDEPKLRSSVEYMARIASEAGDVEVEEVCLGIAAVFRDGKGPHARAHPKKRKARKSSGSNSSIAALAGRWLPEKTSNGSSAGASESASSPSSSPSAGSSNKRGGSLSMRGPR